MASLRQEIADLRSQLQKGIGIDRLPGRPPVAAPSVLSAAPSLKAHSQHAAQAGVGSSGRVLNALKLVEAQLSVSRHTAAGAQLNLAQQEQMLRLQDINTELKAKLDMVLARQAQLQLLADQHIGTSSASASLMGGSSMGEWPSPGTENTLASSSAAHAGSPAAEPPQHRAPAAV